MKINEVAAPGSFQSQLGVFSKDFTSGLLQKAAGTASAGAQSSQTAQNYMQDPQQTIAAVTAPVIAQVSKQQQAMWHENVKALMAQTIDPATGKRGSISQADILLPKLESVIHRQLATTMQQMSGGRIKDFNDADKIFKNSPESLAMVQRMKADTEKLIDTVIMTSPDRKENQRTLAASWNRISANLAKIAALATTQGDTDTTGKNSVKIDKSGKVFVDNQPYNPSNPEHKAALQRMGMA